MDGHEPDRFSFTEAVDQIARRYGVPRSVYTRMLGQESGDDDAAVSPKGAFSAWQIMPATARGLGYDPDELRAEPLKAAEGGLRILRDNYKKFRSFAENEKHAWMMSVAGYHTNPNNVLKDLKRGGYGLPMTSDGSITTRDHVLKIFDGLTSDLFDRSPLGEIKGSSPMPADEAASEYSIDPNKLPEVSIYPLEKQGLKGAAGTAPTSEGMAATAGNVPAVTAENRPVPESDFTIASQIRSALDPQSPRAGVLLTEPERSAKMPPDDQFFTKIPASGGGVLLVNNQKAAALGLRSPAEISAFVDQNGFESLIGKVDPVTDTSKGMALRTETPDGREYSTSVVTTRQSAEDQAARDRSEFGGNVNQRLMPTEQAARERQYETDPTGQITWIPKDAEPDTYPKGPTISDVEVVQTPIEQTATVKGSAPASAPTADDYKTYASFVRSQGKEPMSPEQFQKVVEATPDAKVTASAEVNAPKVSQTQQQEPNVFTSNPKAYAPASPDAYKKEVIGNISFSGQYKEKPTAGQVVNDVLVKSYGPNIFEAAKAYRDATGKNLIEPVDLAATQADIDAYYKDGTYKPPDQPVFARVREAVEAYNKGGAAGVREYAFRRAPEQDLRALKEIKEPDRRLTPTDDELRAQAKENVSKGAFLPGFTTTDKDIEGEFQRLKSITLSEEEARDYVKRGEYFRQNPELAGQMGPDVAVGIYKALGGLSYLVAGVARPLAAMGLVEDAAYTEMSKLGTGTMLFATAAKQKDWLGDVGEIVGQATVDVPKYAAMSTLPIGAVVVFGFDSAAQASGQGKPITEVGGEALKGAMLGGILNGSGRLARMVEKGVLSKLLPPGDIAKVEAGMLDHIYSDPVARRTLVSKLFGAGTRIGTIGSGTFALEKASGADTDEAFKSAIMLSLFDLVMQGRSYGKIADLAGKVFRFSRGGRVADVEVTPSGEVKLLKGNVPNEAVEAEFVTDRVETEKGADGVYRAVGDTSPIREPFSGSKTDAVPETKLLGAKPEAEPGSATEVQPAESEDPFNPLDRSGPPAEIRNRLEAKESPSDQIAEPTPKTENENVHKFSSTQVDLPAEESRQILDLGKDLIKEEDIYTDPKDPSFGREDNPHITVKYGLHTENPAEVRQILGGEKPFEATLGKTSIFPGGPETPYDVVKVDVKSPELHRLNKLISEGTRVTDTHPKYVPHVTLAYVKLGTGEKYAGRADLEGQKIKFDRIAFSSKTGEVEDIPLGGGEARSEIDQNLDNPLSQTETDRISGVRPRQFSLGRGGDLPRTGETAKGLEKAGDSYLHDRGSEKPESLNKPRYITPEIKPAEDLPAGRSERSLFKDLNSQFEAGESERSLVKEAEAAVHPDGIIVTNPPGSELIRRAHRIAFHNPDAPIFYGSYLNPKHAERVFDALRFGVLGDRGSYDLDTRIKAEGFINQLKKAIDNPHRDAVHLAGNKKNPKGLIVAVQEEMAHRSDYRIGLQHAISKAVFPANKIGRKAMRHLARGAYKGAGIDLLAIEVGAKIWRDDAPEELELTPEEVETLQDLWTDSLLSSGKTIEEIRRALENISQTAKNYVRKKREQNNRGDGGQRTPTPQRAVERFGEGETSQEGRGASQTPRTKERTSGQIVQDDLKLPPEKELSRQLSSAENYYIDHKLKDGPESDRQMVKSEVLYSKPPAGGKMTFGDFLIDLTNMPKAIRAAVDLSAAGRQGLISAIPHPIIATRSFIKQIGSLLSTRFHRRFIEGLENHPFREMAEKSGLYLSSLGDGSVNAREEQFMTRLLGEDQFFEHRAAELARRGVSLPVRASERAYSTFLDDLRINVFADLAREVHAYNQRNGVPDNDNETYQKQIEGVARFVNLATGRGSLGRFESAGEFLNIPFFSARYWASRFQVLNPKFYYSLPPGARKAVVSDFGKYLGVMVGMFGLLKMAGFDIETDWDNPDFLKVRIGQYSYDITGGMVQQIRYVAQMVGAAASGDFQKMGKRTGRYVRSKLSPVPGAVINVGEGTNFIGEPTNAKKEAVSLITPISVEQIYEGGSKDGYLGVLLSSPDILGISTARYSNSLEIGYQIGDAERRLVSAKTSGEKKEIQAEIRAWRSLYWRSRQGKGELPFEYSRMPKEEAEMEKTGRGRMKPLGEMIDFYEKNRLTLFSFARDELENLIIEKAEYLNTRGRLTGEDVRRINEFIPAYSPKLHPGENRRPEKLKKPSRRSGDYPKPPGRQSLSEN
ncbi:MAG: transglycosylase SLT domain-containing protein [Pyrinomonadaceae bacterium]